MQDVIYRKKCGTNCKCIVYYGVCPRGGVYFIGRFYWDSGPISFHIGFHNQLGWKQFQLSQFMPGLQLKHEMTQLPPDKFSPSDLREWDDSDLAILFRILINTWSHPLAT